MIGDVIRNTEEMEKFVRKTEIYRNDIETCAYKLRIIAQEIKIAMNDDKGNKAQVFVEEFTDLLLRGLPDLDDNQKKLIKSIGYLHEAEEVKFR